MKCSLLFHEFMRARMCMWECMSPRHVYLVIQPRPFGCASATQFWTRRLWFGWYQSRIKKAVLWIGWEPQKEENLNSFVIVFFGNQFSEKQTQKINHWWVLIWEGYFWIRILWEKSKNNTVVSIFTAEANILVWRSHTKMWWVLRWRSGILDVWQFQHCGNTLLLLSSSTSKWNQPWIK